MGASSNRAIRQSNNRATGCYFTATMSSCRRQTPSIIAEKSSLLIDGRTSTSRGFLSSIHTHPFASYRLIGRLGVKRKLLAHLPHLPHLNPTPNHLHLYLHLPHGESGTSKTLIHVRYVRTYGLVVWSCMRIVHTFIYHRSLPTPPFIHSVTPHFPNYVVLIRFGPASFRGACVRACVVGGGEALGQ